LPPRDLRGEGPSGRQSSARRKVKYSCSNIVLGFGSRPATDRVGRKVPYFRLLTGCGVTLGTALALPWGGGGGHAGWQRGERHVAAHEGSHDQPTARPPRPRQTRGTISHQGQFSCRCSCRGWELGPELLGWGLL